MFNLLPMPLTSLYSGISNGAMTSNSDTWRSIRTGPPAKDIVLVVVTVTGWEVDTPCIEKMVIGDFGGVPAVRWKLGVCLERDAANPKKNVDKRCLYCNGLCAGFILSDLLISLFGGQLTIPKRSQRNCQVCMHMFVCIFLYTYQALWSRTPFTSWWSSTYNSLGESYAKKSSAEILEKKRSTLLSPWKFSYSSFFDCAFNLAELGCVTQQPANFPSLTLTFWRWLTRAFTKNRQHVSHLVSTSIDEINLRFCIWCFFSRNLFLLKKRLTPGISWHSWLTRSPGGYKKKLKLKDDGVALRHVFLIVVTSDSTLRLVGWLGRESSIEAARNPVCHNLDVFMTNHQIPQRYLP